ncbi:MAG: DUF1489 domain-containing protein [Alphaproteobacteria bacterium]|nr:DUF1489 domain-containing protein [Alphaproteobacteria bacterium]
MALHLIKLCVGADSIEDLADWQIKHLATLQRQKAEAVLAHVTRQTPKRSAEILAGGSLYWVIKGFIAVRQRIIGLTPRVIEGVPHCAIALAPPLIPVARKPMRPFQGWRYLSEEAAPEDLSLKNNGLPPELQEKLAVLGLL